MSSIYDYANFLRKLFKCCVRSCVSFTNRYLTSPGNVKNISYVNVQTNFTKIAGKLISQNSLPNSYSTAVA